MRRPKIFYGWWIALSYFVMNFYWGGTLLIGFSVLFNPIKESFGLSATAATAIVSMRQGAAAVGSPFVGWAFDRVGPRPLMLAATILGAGGMSLVAFSHSTWQLVLSFLIASIGFAIFMAGTGPAAVGNWFVRHRGKAITLALAGAGVGAFIVPVVVWLEDQWGWRTALVVIVVGLVAIGLPLSMVLRHRPEQYGLRPDGDPPGDPGPALGSTFEEESGGHSFHAAMRSWSFWLPASGQAVIGLGSGSVALFFFPHLEEQGISKATAGVVVTAAGAVGLAAMLIVGWLSDRWDRRALIAGAWLLQAGSMWILAFASETWHLALYAILFGLGARSSFPMLTALLAEYFGRMHLGKIIGMQIGLFTACSAIGPIIGGVVRDASGSYTLVFAVFASLTMVSFLGVAASRRPTPVPQTTP